jgi:hypothetical protein
MQVRNTLQKLWVAVCTAGRSEGVGPQELVQHPLCRAPCWGSHGQLAPASIGSSKGGWRATQNAGGHIYLLYKDKGVCEFQVQ